MVDGINGNGNSANGNGNSANGNGNGNGANTKSYLTVVVSAKYWWCSLSSSVVFD